MEDAELPKRQNRSTTRERSSNSSSRQCTEAESAPTTTGAYRGVRRSQRVHIRIGVLVYGYSNGKPFQEATTTQVVNAHGALIQLATQVDKGQKLVLTHEKTLEEQTCRVVYLGPVEDGKGGVGVEFEFERPAPAFWHISFPPDDWNASERKLPPKPKR